MKPGKKLLSLVLSLLLVFGTASLAVCAVDGNAGKAAVRVTNSEAEVTIGYKETRYFEFETENLPADASVHVFLNGEDRGESTYFYVSEPTEDYVVEAKILDADGAPIASSGEIKVTVRNGAFDRLKAFLQRTVGTAADAVMDIFSAIFMTILVFLNGGHLF